MHAPERLKGNRTAVPVHAVAIARRPPFGASTAFSSAAVSTLTGADSADVLHVCAGLLRSADGARTASNLSSKDRVSDSRSPLPACLATRPQHVSTRTGCQL